VRFSCARGRTAITRPGRSRTGCTDPTRSDATRLRRLASPLDVRHRPRDASARRRPSVSGVRILTGARGSSTASRTASTDASSTSSRVPAEPKDAHAPAPATRSERVHLWVARLGMIVWPTGFPRSPLVPNSYCRPPCYPGRGLPSPPPCRPFPVHRGHARDPKDCYLDRSSRRGARPEMDRNRIFRRVSRGAHCCNWCCSRATQRTGPIVGRRPGAPIGGSAAPAFDVAAVRRWRGVGGQVSA